MLHITPIYVELGATRACFVTKQGHHQYHHHSVMHYLNGCRSWRVVSKESDCSCPKAPGDRMEFLTTTREGARLTYLTFLCYHSLKHIYLTLGRADRLAILSQIKAVVQAA